MGCVSSSDCYSNTSQTNIQSFSIDTPSITDYKSSIYDHTLDDDILRNTLSLQYTSINKHNMMSTPEIELNAVRSNSNLRLARQLGKSMNTADIDDCVLKSHGINKYINKQYNDTQVISPPNKIKSAPGSRRRTTTHISHMSDDDSTVQQLSTPAPYTHKLSHANDTLSTDNIQYNSVSNNTSTPTPNKRNIKRQDSKKKLRSNKSYHHAATVSENKQSQLKRSNTVRSLKRDSAGEDNPIDRLTLIELYNNNNVPTSNKPGSIKKLRHSKSINIDSSDDMPLTSNFVRARSRHQSIDNGCLTPSYNHTSKPVLSRRNTSANRKIALIVDTIAVSQRLLITTLHKSNYRIDVSESSEQTIQLCTEQQYSVIIIDYKHATIDLVQQIRIIEPAIHQPLIICILPHVSIGQCNLYRTSGCNSLIDCASIISEVLIHLIQRLYESPYIFLCCESDGTIHAVEQRGIESTVESPVKPLSILHIVRASSSTVLIDSNRSISTNSIPDNRGGRSTSASRRTTIRIKSINTMSNHHSTDTQI